MRDLSKLEAIDIQTRHHNLLLRYRNQDRIIQSEAFAEAWSQAKQDQRNFIGGRLTNATANDVKKWILSILQGGLDQHTTKILRQIASYHHIKNYSRMTKLQLLDALTEKGVIDDGSADRS